MVTVQKEERIKRGRTIVKNLIFSPQKNFERVFAIHLEPSSSFQISPEKEMGDQKCIEICQIEVV